MTLRFLIRLLIGPVIVTVFTVIVTLYTLIAGFVWIATGTPERMSITWPDWT